MKIQESSHSHPAFSTTWVEAYILATQVSSLRSLSLKIPSQSNLQLTNFSFCVSEISDRITYLSIAQNLLRSPENHFSLNELLSGENKNGEKLFTADFFFEVDKAAQGLNDRNQIQVISIPRERMFASEKTASQLSDEIIQENCRSMQDNAQFKSKLLAKIIWYRFIKDETIIKEALKSMFNTIKIASKIHA